jgi:twitching motility protein PilT
VDALETINRVIGVFPHSQQEQIRIQMASVLKAIVSQRLVPRKDGRGRIAAVEVLINTQNVKEAIIDPKKTGSIKDFLDKGLFSQYGMQSFDQHLIKLVKRGVVSYEDAMSYATNTDDFALKFKGIGGTSDMGNDDEDDEMQEKKGPPTGVILGNQFSQDDDDDDPFAGDNVFNKG